MRRRAPGCRLGAGETQHVDRAMCGRASRVGCSRPATTVCDTGGLAARRGLQALQHRVAGGGESVDVGGDSVLEDTLEIVVSTAEIERMFEA